MKKICVVTATRAEWSLLRNLCSEIKSDNDLKLQIIATGAHLSPEFGLTYKEIEQEFRIDKKIEILLSSDNSKGVAKTMGLALALFAQALSELKPDIVVILGDRYEMLSVASTCLVMKIPIAHLYGGENTFGAIDDSIRHAITKLSHIHFTSTLVYRQRVLQLGEDPKNVHFTGQIGIENIQQINFLSKDELQNELGFKFSKKNLLITFHPQTLNQNSTRRDIKTILNALKSQKDTMLIFTKANADEGGRVINDEISKFVAKNPKISVLFDNLGAKRYLCVMRVVDGVVGNSSSGICETPEFKKPTINLGSRQDGRVRAKNIIDCEIDEISLKKALEKIYDDKFLKSLEDMVNPYSSDHPSKKIKEIIKNTDVKGIVFKKFYDIKM